MALAAAEYSPMDNASTRLRVLMICAHEPTMDPRIRWEAEGAAKGFHVTVLGFSNANRPQPNVPDAEDYKIVRLPWREVSPLEYALHLRTIISGPVQATIALTVALSWPLLLVCESGSGFYAKSDALRTVSLPIRACANGVEIGVGPRQTIFHRIEFILQSMRCGFAPATSLFWEYLCSMPEKPHVVHCNDLDTLLVGVRAKREFGCRRLYDAHEFWPFADPLSRWIDQSFFSMLERLLIKRRRRFRERQSYAVGGDPQRLWSTTRSILCQTWSPGSNTESGPLSPRSTLSPRGG